MTTRKSKPSSKKIVWNDAKLKEVYGNTPLVICGWKNCGKIVALTQKDIDFRKQAEKIGFGFKKYCPKHLEKMYKKSLEAMQGC